MKLFPRTKARVAHGAQMLDFAVPGWHWRIDTDILDIGSNENCVLGQLYGDFISGCNRLGVDVRIDQDRDYGFFSPLRPAQILLTRAWKREIAERVSEGVVADDMRGATIDYWIMDEVGSFDVGPATEKMEEVPVG